VTIINSFPLKISTNSQFLKKKV